MTLAVAIVATVAGYILINEKLTLADFIDIVLVIFGSAGILLSNLKNNKKKGDTQNVSPTV